MKRFILLSVIAGWALLINAQSALPYWVHNRPATEKDCMYYFRVTKGEGNNYDKAYANAFARAILESSWKLGVDVNTADDLQTIENGINENISVSASHMSLPLNKVCEYTEHLSGRMGIRVYILWQVAKYGNRSPQFEEFTKCE